MWFDGWSDIVRTLIVGAAAYGTLVLVLRFSGKRSLSQLNAFDLIVTVAIGSTLATILLDANVTWVEGTTAFVVLAGLQFVVAFLSSLWPTVRSIVTASPVILLRDGEYRDDALRKNRLTRSEVRQVIRSTGTGDISQVAAVVLEANGQLSILTSSSFGDGSALEDVKR